MHQRASNLKNYKEAAREFEPRWQSYWAKERIFAVPNPGDPAFDSSKPKFLVLDFFPYPSGIGLHVGHPLGYIATDIVSRYKRMCGNNVLHAMGFDAFGLPAEQYAIQTGQHPSITTENNIANMIAQLQTLGFDHDTERRFSTHDPSYYKWTQWIFLQIHGSFYDPTESWTGPDGKQNLGRALPIARLKAKLEQGEWVIDRHGNPLPAAKADSRDEPFQPYREQDLPQLQDRVRIAFQEEVPVNWCPQLGTVLSDEEVTRDGRSERGDFPVYKRPLRQWMFRIKVYADRLGADLEQLDWPSGVKDMQRNWIGRSEGMEIQFSSAGTSPETTITVFTTRPDTIFGATFLVLAPDHPLVDQLTSPEQAGQVHEYRQNTADRKRSADQGQPVTGVFLGSYAKNPATGEAIPVWIADHVLMGYGRGAIMAVPSHDERDWVFANHMGLPVRAVVMPDDEWLQKQATAEGANLSPENLRAAYLHDHRNFREPYTGAGTATQSANSEVSLNGLETTEATEKIKCWLESRHIGRRIVEYRLRNWLFSRQRYWGEPFPLVFDVETGACYPVSADDLPVRLPDLDNFSPTASNDPAAPPEPPLGRATEWATVRGIIQDDGSFKQTPAELRQVEIAGRTYPVRSFRRELNTMPNWAGSCWYYLRYCDPQNDREFVSKAAERYWMLGNRSGNERKIGGVDLYVGGAEHAVLHLLYARFWHKVLYDLGHVSTCEPFQKLFNQGMITADAFKDHRGFYVDIHDVVFRKEDNRTTPINKLTNETLTIDPGKMGKRYKNGLPPEEVCAQFTVDVFRLYEMYMGPLDATKPWNSEAIIGMQRFLDRVYRIANGNLSDEADAGAIGEVVNRTIERVTQDVERLAMNTALAALIELTNAMTREPVVSRQHVRALILMLAPFAPHLAEELFFSLFPAESRQFRSVAFAPWPTFRQQQSLALEIQVPVTVNGRKKAVVTVAAQSSDDAVRTAVLDDVSVRKAIQGKTPDRVVVARSAKGALVNIVVKN